MGSSWKPVEGFRRCLGALFGVSCVRFGRILPGTDQVGDSGLIFLTHWPLLRASWGPLGSLLGTLEVSWGLLEALLGVPWACLGQICWQKSSWSPRLEERGREETFRGEEAQEVKRKARRKKII